MVIGYADTKPYEENNSDEHRARNRRVEIVIHQEVDEGLSAELRDLEEVGDGLLDTLGINESDIVSVN